MNDRGVRSEATRRRKGQSQVVEAAHQYTPKRGWDSFDEAVYKYAQESALKEWEQEGYVWPPGDLQWAHQHMLSFFSSLDEDVFRDISLDRDYALEEAECREAEYRFVVEYREAEYRCVMSLNEDIFRDGALDRDYVLEEAEHRFVVGFRSAWSVASGWPISSILGNSRIRQREYQEQSSLLKKLPPDWSVVPNQVQEAKETRVLSTRTGVKKGHEGVFQQCERRVS